VPPFLGSTRVSIYRDEKSQRSQTATRAVAAAAAERTPAAARITAIPEVSVPLLLHCCFFVWSVTLHRDTVMHSHDAGLRRKHIGSMCSEGLSAYCCQAWGVLVPMQRLPTASATELSKTDLDLHSCCGP
jgi:hypothetical protein